MIEWKNAVQTGTENLKPSLAHQAIEGRIRPDHLASGIHQHQGLTDLAEG